MRKRVLVLLAITVLLMTGGCEGQPAAGLRGSTEGSVRPPVPQPQQDFGTVTLLYGGDTMTGLDTDTGRENIIMDAVCQRILADRNVKLNIRAVFDEEPKERLMRMLAADDPPAICIWLPKMYGKGGREDGISMLPLALNDALESEGKHLQTAIPQGLWQRYTIKGTIHAIPTAWLETSVVAANKKLMDQYGWQLPKTLEQFEQLLDTAHRADAIIVPFSMLFDITQTWFDTSREDILQTPDGLISAMVSPNYLLWQSTMRKWVDNGWMKRREPLYEGNLGLNADKWLFREMRLSDVADTPDTVVLPPIAAVAGAPRNYDLIHAGWAYESYRNPEALVILMDWMITSEENNRLIALGIRDQDYRMVSDSEYEWISGPSWRGFSYFPVSGIFQEPGFRHINGEAYRQALAFYESLSVNNAQRQLPQEAYTYQLENSRLDLALKQFDEYQIALINASAEYIWGKGSINDYQTLALEQQPQLRPYLELIEDIRAGSYDVKGDIFDPYAKAK